MKITKSHLAGAAAFVLCGATAAVASSVTLPHTFTAGTSAQAAQVNANFAAVQAAVDDNDARITTIEGAARPAAKTFQTTSAQFPDAEADMRTISVTVPTGGQITLTVSGALRLGHVTGNTSTTSLFLRMGDAGTKRRVTTWLVPGAWPSANPIYQPFSFTSSFGVGAAGTYSFIISGVTTTSAGADWGDCGAVVQGCPWVTVQFFRATLP